MFNIPRDQLVVITGLSGSGKSSLAFDTIYAEGQRRYVESLSAYARQFLEQMDKPDVDLIEGLITSDLHRTKNHEQESALHRGYGHGNLRLPPSPLRARRDPPLLPLRTHHRDADGATDRRSSHAAPHDLAPPGAGPPGAGTQGRIPQGT